LAIDDDLGRAKDLADFPALHWLDTSQYETSTEKVLVQKKVQIMTSKIKKEIKSQIKRESLLVSIDPLENREGAMFN